MSRVLGGAVLVLVALTGCAKTTASDACVELRREIGGNNDCYAWQPQGQFAMAKSAFRFATEKSNVVVVYEFDSADELQRARGNIPPLLGSVFAGKRILVLADTKAEPRELDIIRAKIQKW